jgi:hypothetical protein
MRKELKFLKMIRITLMKTMETVSELAQHFDYKGTNSAYSPNEKREEGKRLTNILCYYRHRVVSR